MDGADMHHFSTYEGDIALSPGSVGSPDGADSESGAFVVLIVDDEQPIAATLAAIVADFGYTPLVAAHGREALELARAQRPALVITDLMMPHMNGARLIAALRAEAQAERIAPPPIVLMSAAGPRQVAAAAADALLPKPFDIDDVEAILTRFLGPPPIA
jgi:CheY-like chemotaxis protein